MLREKLQTFFTFFLLLIGVIPSFAALPSSQNVIDFKAVCYKFDPNKGTYVVPPNGIINLDKSNLNMDYIISTLINGITQTSGGGKCDKIIVYYTTPKKTKSMGVTIQEMAKPINPVAKSDFVTISDNMDSYFVGIASKLQAAGIGYWIFKSDEIGKNHTVKHVFGIERVNWPYFFAKYIKNYCHQTNGIPPYIIYNQMDFLNAAGEVGNYLKTHPTFGLLSINSSNVLALKNPGFFKLSSSICKETLPQIEKDLSAIQTCTQGTGSGYHYGLYGSQSNKLFADNGFVINYPYVDFRHIPQIIGEFFTSFMFVHNIPRGIMFSDKKIHVSTHHWTTGKWPWQKRIHSRRTWTTGSESYDIIYAQFIQPFGQYTFTKDWSNIELSYVASVNNIPAYVRQLITLTPDNHQITHVFKKGGEISDLGNWSYSKEVSRHLGFNWIAFIVTIAAIGVLTYVGALYFTSGLAAGGMSFSSYLSFITAYPSALFGQLVGSAGLIGAYSALGIATALSVGTVSTIGGNWFVKKANTNSGNNTVFNMIVKNLSNDVIGGTSIRTKQIQLIPILISKQVETKSMVPPIIYKVILRNSPTLSDSNTNVIPQSEFLTQYGTYFNMVMYANHTDIGEDFYNGGQVATWAKGFVNNMTLNGSGSFMNPKDALITIMKREWGD